MKKATQYILALLFVILIIELVFLSPSEVKDKTSETVSPPATAYNAKDKDVNQAMSGIHMIQTHNEAKEWELWANAAIGFKQQKELAIEQVKVNFFTSNGVTFDVTGDRGFVVTDTKNLTIDGKVVTKSSNGYVFKTNSAEYDSAGRTLRSPSPVEVTGPRGEDGQAIFISGDQMHANLNDSVVMIEKNVLARKSMDQQKKLNVQAEKVKLSGREKTIRFYGNVTIDIDGVRIKGPDALFNYDSISHELKSIDLSGGVKVSDLSKWATSDNLKIDLVKNEFEFSGRPRVVQDDDEVRGDRIVFLDGGKRVKVQNAKIKVSPEANEDLSKGQKQ